jgi:hypothetical protein
LKDIVDINELTRDNTCGGNYFPYHNPAILREIYEIDDPIEP